jgi:hypothetical protein
MLTNKAFKYYENGYDVMQCVCTDFSFYCGDELFPEEKSTIIDNILSAVHLRYEEQYELE